MTTVPPLPVLNVGWWEGAPALRPLSNLARTPFELDGVRYETVVGFWRGLPLPPDDPERARLAAQTDGPAIEAAWRARAGWRAEGGRRPAVVYGGRQYRPGGPAHHLLLERALRAKFAQDDGARAALMATGQARLTYVPIDTRGQPLRDSATLPGLVVAGMLMAIRTELRYGDFRPTLPLPAGDAPEAGAPPPQQLALF